MFSHSLGRLQADGYPRSNHGGNMKFAAWGTHRTLRLIVIAAMSGGAFVPASSFGQTPSGVVRVGVELAQTSAKSDTIRSILLGPASWTAFWSGPGGSGLNELKFEARTEKVVVKIKNITYSMSCEKDVTITSDGIHLEGCIDTGAVLRFDPNDPEYPFKGKSPRGYEWKLKPN
jgi:hypothetical protein